MVEPKEQATSPEPKTAKKTAKRAASSGKTRKTASSAKKTAAKTAPKRENRRFQAETKQLLNLMIHSLYTHKEIFLRELISNASDALDKIRFRALTDANLAKESKDLEIWISIDKDQKSLSISDNGVGMTRDEVIENIGTIAQSGSKAFIQAMESAKGKDEQSQLDLIGQFGVGFYSAFMVAKKIELITRAAGSKEAVRWESDGQGEYVIEPWEREERGATVTVYLRDDLVDPDQPEEDFLNQYTIQNLVRRYSNYIEYPIKLGFVTEEHPRDEEGNRIEDAEPETKVDVRTMNTMTPLWERNKKDVSDDEYFQFFKHHFHDWNEPADIIHIKVEGQVQYTALLYVPSQPPVDLYSADYKKGIQLYSKHVFVMDNCRDLLPEHFRFVRGLVDSPDFSLNISREILQHDRQLKIIGKNLEKKVSDALKKMLKDDRKKYEEWWDGFGKAIKGGVYMHYTNKEKLQDLLLFPSSKSAEGMATLREYVDRMPETQKEIYYETGKDRAAIERLPQMETVLDRGLEVLYFTDKVDEFLTQNLWDYDDKKFKSVSRGDLDLDDDKADKDKDKKEEGAKKEEGEKDEAGPHQALLAAVKESLGDKVKEVRLSKRLKTSACCLVSSDAGPSLNMEILLKEANQMMGKAQRILELNPDHEIFQGMAGQFAKNEKDPIIGDYAELLFSQAMLIEGLTLDDPVEFANRLNKVMAAAQQSGS